MTCHRQKIKKWYQKAIQNRCRNRGRKQIGKSDAPDSSPMDSGEFWWIRFGPKSVQNGIKTTFLKIDAENGMEKRMKSSTKHTKHHQNGVRGGRAECLHPAQHPLQHLTLKLLRTLRREKCLRQTKERVRAEKVRDEKVLCKESAREMVHRRNV